LIEKECPFLGVELSKVGVVEEVVEPVEEVRIAVEGTAVETEFVIEVFPVL